MNNNNLNDCPDFLKEFLFYIQTIKGRSERTVDGYYIDLRLFFRFIKSTKQLNHDFSNFDKIKIQDLPISILSQITRPDIYAFLNYTLSTRENKANSRSRKISSVRSFFKYITTKTSYLSENPAIDIDLPTAKKSIPKYLSLEESLSLLSSIQGDFVERNYCIITLFLNCGMRLSELVGINHSDIKENTIRLLGKGNKERIIYLNDACVNAITQYQDYKIQLYLKTKPKDEKALFLTTRGTRISARRIQQIVEECLQYANLSGQGYSPHKLRHTAATLMYQHGNVDIRILKEILGHQDISTTEIYTHMSSKQMEQAADSSPLANIKIKK
ncbi:MAG: tyrosine-type recombinase/integrase [Oscillospiraceae bacterium]